MMNVMSEVKVWVSSGWSLHKRLSLRENLIEAALEVGCWMEIVEQMIVKWKG